MPEDRSITLEEGKGVFAEIDKNTCFSYRETEHKTPVTTAPGDMIPSYMLCGHLQVHVYNTDTYISENL